MTPASLVPVNGNKREPGGWSDDVAVSIPDGSFLWMRLERKSGTDDFYVMYYIGADPNPASADFTPLKDSTGANMLVDISAFAENLQIGACVQSGDLDNPTELALSNMKIEFNPSGSTSTTVDPEFVMNKDDWENADTSGVSFTSRYLASQYQVFWGPYDITESFFTYSNAVGDLIATEDWIYNTREFYSSSRWWSDGVEKDADPVLDGNGTVRELLSKQTILSLDMGILQDYLISTDMNEALANEIVGGYGDPADLTNPPLLKERFNGIIFVARTNRYPWNPNLDEDNADGAKPLDLSIGYAKCDRWPWVFNTG